jgi:hypothetical protein
MMAPAGSSSRHSHIEKHNNPGVTVLKISTVIQAVGLKSKGLSCAKFVLGTYGKGVFITE